ncbi:helix-turn-helix transcriptional regulator [Streptomyces sp. NPDC048479]|uniref:helix-turn-helix transcriptional regulator n=1 Tax=Streptomyces sp. NPDC048479 TaxID=3154725 RepID=UPI003443244B
MTGPVLVGPSPSGGGPVPSLTAGELKVLVGVASGHTYEAIARANGNSQRTARNLGKSVLKKLGARSMPQAILLACRAGLLDGRPRRHGDHPGFAAHVYRGEDPCEACCEGERAYRADRRAARKAVKSHAA